MEIKEFTEKVRGAIERELGEGYRVELREVTKNNGTLLQGLLIIKEEGNLVPTIYLDSFYSEYQNGRSLSGIVQVILDIYRRETPHRNFDMDFFRSYELVKDRICYRLINRQKNERLLEDVPYVEFLDLAVCFYYAYHDDAIGDGTILIHNSHIDMWKVTTRDLLRCAAENTPRLYPVYLEAMEEVLKNMLDCNEEGMTPGDNFLSVLTNQRKTDGAVCMIYPDVLHQHALQKGKNFYIIPSSVHEVLLLDDNGEESVEEIKSMIRDVNKNHLEESEILSYRLYYYDLNEKNVRIL